MSHYSTQKKNVSWCLFLGCFLCAMIFSCDGKSPTLPNQDSWVAANNGLENLFIQFLAVNPVNSDIIFAGTWDGLYRSVNAGQTWARVDSGWAYTQISAIAFDPLMDEVMYAGTSGAGVMKSEDGGESWESRNVGLPDRIVWCIATDPQYPDTIFVGTDGGICRSYDSADSLSEIHWLPRAFLAIDPDNSQKIYAGGKWHNFHRSTDGGDSWDATQPEGLPLRGPAVNIQWILIDPTNPRILYVASNDLGIYKSTDGGLTFSEANTGLWTVDVRNLALNLTEQVLYAATDKGVARSTVGAETWQKMNEGLSNLDVKALVLAFSNPPVLYAGTWGAGVFIWKAQ